MAAPFARTGELEWRNEAHASLKGTLKMADVAVIRVDTASDTSTIKLFDARGELMPFGGAEIVPWRPERWAREAAQRYPHIRVEMADKAAGATTPAAGRYSVFGG